MGIVWRLNCGVLRIDQLEEWGSGLIPLDVTWRAARMWLWPIHWPPCDHASLTAPVVITMGWFDLQSPWFVCQRCSVDFELVELNYVSQSLHCQTGFALLIYLCGGGGGGCCCYYWMHSRLSPYQLVNSYALCAVPCKRTLGIEYFAL